MSWLHRNQWVLYCQLNCVCHQMKLLLEGVASFLGPRWGGKKFSRQLHGLWFMCLIKTLLNARLDTWKDLEDLYFVAIVLLAGCVVFLSIPDEQLPALGFLRYIRFFMDVINSVVQTIHWNADCCSPGKYFVELEGPLLWPQKSGDWNLSWASWVQVIPTLLPFP
jgi:hypothetical protein